ncbi:MAG TPA: TonB-dependent receptor [Prolixibacteraceae bacterium]|nr:TonB-dependent receptor [Prolixibacteraceae bacterium]
MKEKHFSDFLLGKAALLLTFMLTVILMTPNSFAGNSMQQGKKMVTGTVTDAKTNVPLPALTVLIKGTTIGSVTDLDGKYSILASDRDILVFSFIGYREKEVAVGDQSMINVSLEEDIYGLDEVIVTGYGVQKKSDLTGAVSSVSSERLTNLPLPNLEQALQGQAAGVNITSKSGRPGEGVTIQIRGISSINGTEPLVIIDGVAGDLNLLNPSDIESIEVLKDASSSAIYGATGGNGVILVTTKLGKTGKIRTTLNAYRGVESAINMIEMMNSQEWMAVNEEIEWENSRKKTWNEALNTEPDTLPTYNWQDFIFKPALMQNYDMSVSGGNEFSNILFSASYNDQEGIIRKTNYQRLTLRLNAEQKLSNRITFDQKISFVNTKGEGLDEWKWHHYYWNPINSTLQMDPSIPEYDENGQWTISNFSTVHPSVKLDVVDKVNQQNHFEGNFGLKINILKGLDFTSRFTGKLGFGDVKQYTSIYYASPTDNNPKDELYMNMDRSLSYTAQNMLNYQVTIARNHNLSLMVGMEANKWWGYNIEGTRLDMSSSDPWMLYFTKSTNSSDDIQNVDGTGYIGATQAYFGRLNYDFMGKYLLTINVRRDGSSSFGPRFRWGTFPSFSVGWKFTEEEFMKNVSAISFGKLRFGYGQTGANARTGFPYLSQVVSSPKFRYSVDNVTTQVGTGPFQIANTEIHWESVNMSNLGLDLSLFDNRLSITADVFDKVNEGMLMLQEVSRIAGTFNGSYPEVNVGSLRNMGYEITITGRKSEGELKGSIDLNFSGVRNEVISLAEDSLLRGGVHVLSPTNLTCIGQPVAQFYGFQTDGLFRETDPTEVIKNKTYITNQPYQLLEDGSKKYAQPKAVPGDVRIKDVNNDGKISDDDKVNLGSPLPILVYGFNINLEYKGFDLSAFFNGTVGNKILNGIKQYTYYHQGYVNRAKAFNDRYVEKDIYAWVGDTGDSMLVVQQNLDTDMPRFNSENYNKVTDFFIEDGSYFRLKNLVIGYTLPKTITSVVGIEKLRIYGGAKNLFTLTKYTGLDPEVTGITPGGNSTSILESGVDLGVYPLTRMFYFGVNIAF